MTTPSHIPILIALAVVTVGLLAWVVLDMLLIGMEGVSDEEMQP